MSDWINDRTAPTETTTTASWHVVVPVKGGPDAKSRLRPPDGVDRSTLARALALDTIDAACRAVGGDRLVVVTSDADVAESVRSLRARTVPDPGGGLNAAIQAGVGAVLADVPGAPVAVLLGDLPALRPADLLAALAAVPASGSGFVADAEGTGTVLLATHGPATLEPRFGAGSAAAHAADGHLRLAVDTAGLRRDVDDEHSLREALGLGVGPHTASLLAHLIVGFA